MCACGQATCRRHATTPFPACGCLALGWAGVPPSRWAGLLFRAAAGLVGCSTQPATKLCTRHPAGTGHPLALATHLRAGAPQT